MQCYTVLGALLFYNVEAEAAELEKRSALGVVVSMWVKDAADVEKRSSRKAAVLGWLALISLGSERLDRNGIDVGVLIRGVIDFGKGLHELYDGMAGEEEDEDEDGMGPDIGEVANWGDIDGPAPFEDADEDGDVNISGAAYNPTFGDSLMFFGGEGKWDDDDEEEEFESAIDDVNEFILLEEVLSRFGQTEPQRLDAIKAGLPPESLVAVSELISAAHDARGVKS